MRRRLEGKGSDMWDQSRESKDYGGRSVVVGGVETFSCYGSERRHDRVRKMRVF